MSTTAVCTRDSLPLLFNLATLTGADGSRIPDLASGRMEEHGLQSDHWAFIKNSGGGAEISSSDLGYLL